MSTPSLFLDPMGRLFRENEDLQAGVHMRVIGEAMCESARRQRNASEPTPQLLAITIMDASNVRDESFEKSMEDLVAYESPHQRTMAAKLIKYKSLPISAQQDELPDNFDLLEKKIALETLVTMGQDYEGRDMDIYRATDAILRMDPDEVKHIVTSGYEIEGNNYNHLVPLGFEIE